MRSKELKFQKIDLPIKYVNLMLDSLKLVCVALMFETRKGQGGREGE